MLQICRFIVIVSVYLCLLISVAFANQGRSVEDFSATAGKILQLAQHLQSAQRLQSAQHDAASLAALRNQLIQQVEKLQACRLLLDERMRSREARLKNGNTTARNRHREFAGRLNKRLQEVDDILQRIVSQSHPEQPDLEDLSSLLKQLTSTKQMPLHGSTPYRQLQFQTVAPMLSPPIVPAYQTDSIDYTTADIQSSPEAPLSQTIHQQALTIAESAGKQNWDPVDLYEWVKNNVRTEWYRGSMKGAEETLRQRSGNDADQASLLIALLRAAGYPARYVRGVVEFFPDLDMARRLTGIDDAENIGELFRKAGIPHQPVMAGSEVVNYQIEHIWVETLIPYANYRGSLADMNGKLWLPLDTSLKVAEFVESGTLDLYSQSGQPLSTLRDDYLGRDNYPGSAQELMPLEFLHEEVDAFLAASSPEVLYNSVLHQRLQQPENLHILSTAPQFNEVAVTGEYNSLPDDLIHKVRLTAVDTESGTLPVFDVTLPVRELSNQLVQISFEPDTVEDQETINLWGGLDNTPAYLVHLRPVLIVDGTRVVVGQQGFPVGKDFSLTVTMQSPAGSVEVENRLVVGYPQLLGIVAQDVSFADASGETGAEGETVAESETGSAVDLLYQTALDYVDSWNRDEQEIADLLNLKLARPLPTLVSLGGMMDVTELLGQPQSVTWTGLFLDADIRAVEAVSRSTLADNRLLSFMQLSALQGSALEHQVLEEHFQVESISTSKLFSLAQAANVPVITLNAENIATTLPDLALSQTVQTDISAAIAEGMVVQILAQSMAFSAWSGTGYLKESAATGESGYMLSGSIAGGNTVLGKEFWPEDVVRKMEKPYRGEPNSDILAAHSLTSITPWQIRQATSGEELSDALMVRVEDGSGVPVVGAPVTFTVSKGAGSLLDDTVEPVLLTQSLTVTSGYDGIARARFVPGESVYNNPIVVTRPDDEQANIAGENLIAAQLVTGSLAALDDPIIVLGFAGQPGLQMTQVIGEGKIGDVLSYAGDAGLILQDRFGNPVANHTVQFAVQDAVANPSSACTNPSSEQPAELVAADDSCMKQLPVSGECSNAAETITLKSRTDGGAMTGVILGGIADAGYPLVATLQTTTASASQIVINQYTAANGACGIAPEPVEKLVLTYPRLRDAEGRNIDARPVGDQARLNIKAYLLSEGAVEEVGREILSCSPEPDRTCNQMAGNGEFTIFAPDEVTGNGSLLQRVSTMPESTAMPYLYGLDLTLAEGLNQVPLSATATYRSAVIDNDCSGCGTIGHPLTVVGPIEEVVEIWGVSLQLPDALIASVDEHGRLLRDTAFNYTIQPAEYSAGMAQALIYADGDLWEAILATTSGSAEVIIPAGYTFLPNKNYEIQILLGNPGDANAIYSEKTSFLPVVSKVDLYVDGLPNVVEDQIGAFVLLNNDYDERDNDASITLLDVETPTILRTDDELKRAWLHIDDVDMLNGHWQVRANDSSQLRIYYEDGDELFEMKPEDPPQLITETPLTISLYLEGVTESTGLHSNSLTLTYVSSQGSQISDSLPLTVLKFDLAVDGNRDREIEFDSKADESALFWVNNDRDVETSSSDDELNTEDDEETGDDSLDNKIPCRRDLEDFARLQVAFGIAVLPEQLTFTAKTEGSDGRNVPMLNLFPAVSLTDDYLGLGDDPTVSNNQLIPEMLAAVGEEPVAIPSSSIETDSTSGFLYEGRNNGKGRLVLKVNYNGMPVLQREIDLSLYDINYFYDHFVVEESGNTELPVNSSVNSVGMFTNASREALYQPSSDEYVMFVHGWNMEPWKKKVYAETMFKRLWWQGYEGRMGLFDWPCRTMPSWDFPTNYDDSEFLAWHSAKSLQALMSEIKKEGASVQIRLLAHSQGNVVAGEAFNLSEPGLVHTYIASQAALPASFYYTYDKNVGPSEEYLLNFTPETPDVISFYPEDINKRPYLYDVFSREIKMISYFNFEDYALVKANALWPAWQFNNISKPDGTAGYHYEGNSVSYPPQPGDKGFYHILRGAQVFPDDRYEIFSFGAESRTKALGAVTVVPGFMDISVTVDQIGSRDLSLYGYNGELYSHSREFRSNIIDEHKYWSRFFKDAELERIWQ